MSLNTTISRPGDGPTTLNTLLVALVRLVADAVSVYPVPAVSMLRLEKVATPLTAAAVVVPERVPPFGFVPIATMILVVAVITVLPWASWTATRPAAVTAPPAYVLLGCSAKMSLAAAARTMLNALLVAPVRPVADAVSV